VKARRQLELRFEPQAIAVRWVEFPYGPPLLEALTAGGIDYGYTGDAPPIFAQAARAAIRYVGVIPARGYGQAIIVPLDSTVRELTNLKGKKVAVAKGSSAHNLLISALERANLSWSEVTPVYLAPGAVDAWSIWDPFYAIAELKQKAWALPIDPKATIQNSFFLANRDFLVAHADVVSAINMRSRPRRFGQASIATKRPSCLLMRAESTSPRRSAPSTAPSSPSDRSPTKSSPNSRPSPTGFSVWA
jgi:sulfonate transport system substrate-binding protein